MALVSKIKRLMRDKKGDEAVSFLMTTALLVFIFATLVSVMIYVMQYYNASYVCRRVVRNIEITGIYDETATRSIVNQLQSPDLENVGVQIDAVYFSGREIQLRQTFSVTLTANYRITILSVGENPIAVRLPIKVKVAGMSEVFFKT